MSALSHSLSVNCRGSSWINKSVLATRSRSNVDLVTGEYCTYTFSRTSGFPGSQISHETDLAEAVEKIEQEER